MIGRRETLRLAPKSFVFGLFEATFDQNNLSHADFATRGDSDAFARSSHMVYAFDGSQPAASAHRRTAARAFGRSVSAPRGHSRVVEFSTRHQERVTPSTRTIVRSIWLKKSPKARRCAAAWRDRGFRHFWAHAVDARASDSESYGAG